MNHSSLRNLTVSLSRHRIFPLTIIYSVIACLSIFLAFLVGFDFEVPPGNTGKALVVSFWAIPIKLIVLLAMGQYRGLMTYFRLPDLIQIFKASVVSCLILLLLFLIGGTEWSYPRRVILLDFVFSIVLLSVFRLALRRMREQFVEKEGKPLRKRKNVVVVGAGDLAARVANDLLSKRSFQKRPMVMLDTGESRVNRSIHGIPVKSIKEDFKSLKNRYALSEVVLATMDRTPKLVQEITVRAKTAGLTLQVAPEYDRFVLSDHYQLNLRPVEIQDLLEREQVEELDCETVRELINGNTIMVTGAGGSIGSELCRQIIRFRPQTLLMVERCEIQLYLIQQELQEFKESIVGCAADIRDEETISVILEKYRPSILFHAAAHKHVPIMEEQPWEAVKNNSLGTIGLAKLANKYEVDKFVLVSTDKAINPTSVMGASKRLSEKLIFSYSRNTNPHTKYCAVRFGNVMGSSGSVIPLFEKQIARGGPVTVTHPDVTRYFMTIPEAVGLVLQSATMVENDEIFLLDMGKPVLISDLAKKMISLSGLVPDRDIEIKFTGLRPGEKLFEELQLHYEEASDTSHSQIFKLKRTIQTSDQDDELLANAHLAAKTYDIDKCKILLKQVVPEFILGDSNSIEDEEIIGSESKDEDSTVLSPHADG